MKTYKLMILSAMVVLATACGPRSAGDASESSQPSDSTAGPGVGMAPDNDDDAKIDSTSVQADSARQQQ